MRRSRTLVVLTLGLMVATGGCAENADRSLDTTDPPTEPDVTNEPPDETEPGAPDPTPPTTVAPETATTTPSATNPPATTLELAPTNPSTTPRPSTPSTTAGDPVGSNEPLYPGQIDTGLNPFIDIAIADLAERLGADPKQISTVSAVLVTWPDGSLGCPSPGMEYAQALQDGSIIELSYASKVYRYHSGGNRTPFLCDQPLAAPPVTGGAADD